MIDMRLIEQSGIILLALAAGVTGYIFYNRKTKQMGGRVDAENRVDAETRVDTGVRVDASAEDLYLEIAGKLAEQMGIPAEQILSLLRQEGKVTESQNATPVLHMECTFRKLSASTVEIEIVAAFLKDGKPMASTLSRQLSWDDVPANVRSDFIHTSQKELHYSLGSNVKPQP